MLISWQDASGASNSIEVDATIQEAPTFSAQATEHYVEKGANISDHVRPNPARLSIEAIVSNTPLQLPRTQNRNASQTSNSPVQFSPDFDRVRDVYAAIRDLVLGGTLVNIDIGIQVLTNMVLLNLSAPRTVDMGASQVQGKRIENGLRFSFDAMEIRFVDVQTAASQRKTVKARSDRGSQTAKKQDSSQQSSTLFNILFGK